MTDPLKRADRLRLVKFVCSFAWADLTVRQEERDFVARIVHSLGLEDEDLAKVEGWLEVPPSPESVDPISIPAAHRKIFLDSIEGVIVADGEVAREERESFALLKELLG
jgi:uncharacterized tellurite resistance protein B-like protein